MNHAQLVALGRSLRAAGEHEQRLTGDAGADMTEMRRDIERSMDLLNEAISAPKPVTRCPEHPLGPVDQDAVDLCLLCETRRRAGQGVPARQRPGQQDDGESTERVPSSYAVRSEQPQPKKRWIPEMWNGTAWQLCGTPRHTEKEAEEHLEQLRRSPDAASAHRIVYAFTDHAVVRVWGTPTVRPRSLEL